MNPGPFQRQLIKPPLAPAEDRVRGRPLDNNRPSRLGGETGRDSLGGGWDAHGGQSQMEETTRGKRPGWEEQWRILRRTLFPHSTEDAISFS